jgi:hypothetical protein
MTNLVSVAASSVLQLKKEPRLAYLNFAKTAANITASHDASSVAALYDDMTTVKWRPGVSGVSYVQFESTLFANGVGQNLPTYDYAAVVGCNWATAGASIIVKDENDTIVGQVTGLRDNQPAFMVFESRTSGALRFEFTASNASLEVGEIYYGKTTELPRNVSVGYQPGRWTTNDIITTGRTESNQFSNSTIRARGTTERFSINYVPLSFMEVQYVNFINDAKGLPVFFLWNQNERSHAVYGYWDASPPRFTSSLYSSIDLTIRGVA